MGTSTRQASPPTLNWQAVTAVYKTSDVPLERVIAEVWRAPQHPDESLIADISSPLVFQCQQTLREAQTPQDVATALSRLLWRSKNNTLVAELAKRAAVASAGQPEPVRVWRQHFFSQVTD